MTVKKKKIAGKKAAKKAVKKPVKKPVKKTKKITTKSVKKSAAKKRPQSTKTAKPTAKAKSLAAKKSTIAVKKSVAKSMIKKQPLKGQSKTAMKSYPQTRMEETFTEDMTVAPSTKPTTLLGALEFMPYQAKENETYMNEVQRDHFRKILDAWKQQLMQDVDATVGHLKEEAVFYADPVDRASQEEGFNLELRTRDRERRLIKKIEQSLDLLNKNEYGFCEDCGAEIGIRRLEARPTAVKCIDCKTFQEIREKQLGS